jgi:EmrB/QacA subfamily drug resistance transporter
MSTHTSGPAERAVPATEPTAVPKNIRLTLLGVMLAMLLAMLDNMVVGTSMPTIVGDLGGLAHISWVVTAYTLATAASTPVWGKFGDLYGRKHIFLASIVVFLVGSALSGAAQSMNALIAFRALQGLGAGGLAAGAFALIGALVPPRERGRYQGMTASVMAIGTIGGPLLGGFVTGHLGWRWAFYINLPIGLLALVWCQVMLRLPAIRSKARIDWLGIALMTFTISSVVLTGTWAGTRYTWASWQIGALAVAVVVGLAAFIASQRRAVEPVLPLRVFETRNFRLSSMMIFAVGAAMFGATLYLPLYQQSVQGASATSSGLLLLPMMLPVVVLSQIAGKVMSKTGRYKIFPVLGAALMTAGMLLLATMDVNTSRTVTSCYMVVAGAGLGLLMQMPTTIAQNSVGMRDMGVASAGVTLFRTIGGSLGVAVFGSLFTRATQGHLPGAGGASRGAYLHAVATGTHEIFLVAAAVCAAAFVAALFVKEVPLRGKPAAPQAPAETAPPVAQAR